MSALTASPTNTPGVCLIRRETVDGPWTSRLAIERYRDMEPAPVPPLAHHCARCPKINPKLRCLDCFAPKFLCCDCMVEQHEQLPFHRIEMWTAEGFEGHTLQGCGLRVRLGQLQCRNKPAQLLTPVEQPSATVARHRERMQAAASTLPVTPSEWVSPAWNAAMDSILAITLRFPISNDADETDMSMDAGYSNTDPDELPELIDPNVIVCERSDKNIEAAWTGIHNKLRADHPSNRYCSMMTIGKSPAHHRFQPTPHSRTYPPVSQNPFIVHATIKVESDDHMDTTAEIAALEMEEEESSG
ncbi:hypothetical protein C8R43DRAFT_1143005 [Mycena crocata]|nr:hypothetical protein C8R43DRAFT_1143005 [Mycena crocata]